MIGSVVTAVLAFLSEISPMISTVSQIGKAIAMVETIVPAVVQEAKDLYPTIKNWIDMMRSKEGITPEQLNQLDAIESKIDADWQAASDAADAEDTAAPKVDPAS